MKQLTERQRLVYEHLRRKKNAQSAYDILHDLGKHGFRAPVQIYRILDKLLENGLIHRIESLNGFITCDQHHETGRSIVAICDDCGSVEEMRLQELEDKLTECGVQQGFVPKQVIVELKGRCSLCQVDAEGA